MDWSSSGQLLTGDCRGIIHLWQPQQSRSWHVDQRPYSAHSKSVEDIQWSPNESTVSGHPKLLSVEMYNLFALS